MSLILKKCIEEFTERRDLAAGDAEAFLDAMISESDEDLLASVFRAWNEKGIAADEIFSIASVMRSRMVRVTPRHETIVDIVGTGGSRAKTFNVSTAASFVVAGAGIAVAKHGNKAATSNSGSADVLSALGINPAADPQTAENCLNEIGICFMFAPNYHRLSATLATVRRGLGFPTIFNCVGPLCNPASAPHQLIGVWDAELVPKMADALRRLGTKRSWIVHGTDGLDEISLTGKTLVAEVTDEVQMFEITPDYFGSNSKEHADLRSTNTDHSATMIRNVLTGRPHAQGAEDLVLMNAAAAYSLAAGGQPAAIFNQLRESLLSGASQRKFEQLAEAIPA
ncbi:MAG: anthranilate phosphoribosyltransferase [Pyrinomonadaceae bacterium]|nr:anthranilate phosphoribosyltransferase [Pyrinomonadaceae bacterium]